MNDQRGIPKAAYIGFTGTRQGMFISQFDAVHSLLVRLRKEYRAETVVHGDAVGADAQFDTIAAEVGLKRIAYPAAGPRKWVAKNRAFCKVDMIHQGKPPLFRNRAIVDRCAAIIAAPKGFQEEPRGSGTWATIRYAAKVGKPLYVVFPDGRIKVGWRTDGG